MVKGLDVFKEHFRGLESNYTIIGGTACDCWISGENLKPRGTNDIDLLIVLEEYNPMFNQKLWEFINLAGYASLIKEMKEQNFYRFEKPQNVVYPSQLEFMCRDPKIIQVPEGKNITALNPGEDFSHLSVMIMNDEYYRFTLQHSELLDGAHIAGIGALICLKALAFLNLTQSKSEGRSVDSRDISKHKNDVFRLGAILRGDTKYSLPEQIANDLGEFIRCMEEEKPDIRQMLKAMGINDLSIDDILTAIKSSFGLNS